MDPTILQQLYSSKHILKVSSKYEIDNGALTEIGGRGVEYIYHTGVDRCVMIEPQIPDIGHDLPIKIRWDRRSVRIDDDESIDYEYMAQQCINDPSTINFGFKFTNGPYSERSYMSEVLFEMDQIVKIVSYSREQVQTLDMIIQHIKDINVEYDYFNGFWWTRRISGILECLGG